MSARDYGPSRAALAELRGGIAHPVDRGGRVGAEQDARLADIWRHDRRVGQQVAAKNLEPGLVEQRRAR
jgi:hypothetical protein